jgi:hypothetical protein
MDILKSKGYMVHDSCSGHIWQENPESYITFNEYIYDSDFPNIPEGHTEDCIGNNITFKK